MGKIEAAIPVNDLAKILDVHRKTLSSWLCHYSLAGYAFQTYSTRGMVNMFVLNKKSISALRKYLSSKRKKYLAYLDARMEKVRKYVK